MKRLRRDVRYYVFVKRGDNIFHAVEPPWGQGSFNLAEAQYIAYRARKDGFEVVASKVVADSFDLDVDRLLKRYIPYDSYPCSVPAILKKP